MPIEKIVTDLADFDTADILPFAPRIQDKNLPNGQRVNYVESQFRYNHLVDGRRVPSMMLIQMPEVSLAYGLRAPDTKKDRLQSAYPPKHSVAIKLVGEAGEQIREFLVRLRKWSVDSIVEAANADKLGPLSSRMKKYELVDDKIAKSYHDNGTSPPTRYLDLVEFDGKISTKFTKMVFDRPGDVSSMRLEDLDPKQLIGKSIDVIMTFFCKRIYLGQNSTIQVFLDSAIVTRCNVSSVAPAVKSAAMRAAERMIAEKADFAGMDAALEAPAASPAPSKPEAESEHEETDHELPEPEEAEPEAEPAPPVPARRVIRRAQAS